jgi:hypothetical protein
MEVEEEGKVVGEKEEEGKVVEGMEEEEVDSTHKTLRMYPYPSDQEFDRQKGNFR